MKEYKRNIVETDQDVLFVVKQLLQEAGLEFECVTTRRYDGFEDKRRLVKKESK